MNKKEMRHQVIRSIIQETNIQSQQDLLLALQKMVFILHNRPYQEISKI